MLQSAAKRYKVTGSGKVMVRRAGKQHLNEKQSRKTKRNLRCVRLAGQEDWACIQLESIASEPGFEPWELDNAGELAKF